MCYEKRLVAAHESMQGGSGTYGSHATSSNSKGKGSAYGELGEVHCSLGNFEQAVSCMDHQLKAAR